MTPKKELLWSLWEQYLSNVRDTCLSSHHGVGKNSKCSDAGLRSLRCTSFRMQRKQGYRFVFDVTTNAI